MIIGFFGNIGDGKTYNAVRMLLRLHLKGYVIYSNTWLGFPYNPLTIDFLIDIVEKGINPFKKAAFFIDEMHIWLDSRTSGSKRNRIISYMLSQTRKLAEEEQGLILLFTTQYAHQVDKRLKSFLDIGVESEKVSVGNKRFFALEIHNFKGRKSFSYKRIIECKPCIYNLYDTKRIIKVERESKEVML